jgi:hypothetical protein
MLPNSSLQHGTEATNILRWPDANQQQLSLAPKLREPPLCAAHLARAERRSCQMLHIACSASHGIPLDVTTASREAQVATALVEGYLTLRRLPPAEHTRYSWLVI